MSQEKNYVSSMRYKKDSHVNAKVITLCMCLNDSLLRCRYCRSLITLPKFCKCNIVRKQMAPQS